MLRPLRPVAALWNPMWVTCCPCQCALSAERSLGSRAENDGFLNLCHRDKCFHSTSMFIDKSINTHSTHKHKQTQTDTNTDTNTRTHTHTPTSIAKRLQNESRMALCSKAWNEGHPGTREDYGKTLAQASLVICENAAHTCSLRH